MMLLGIAILVIGFAVAVFFYRTSTGNDRLRETHPTAYKALEYRYCDTFYNWYIAKVQQRVAMLAEAARAHRELTLGQSTEFTSAAPSRDLETCLAMVNAGAERIGCSASVAIAEAYAKTL